MIQKNIALGEEIEEEEKPIRLKEENNDEEFEEEEEEEGSKLDPHLRETLQVLQDYIKLLDPKKQIAGKAKGIKNSIQ